MRYSLLGFLLPIAVFGLAVHCPGQPSRRLILQPDDGRTIILEVLGAARRSVDLTAYSLDDTLVQGVLMETARRGVAVRIIYSMRSIDDRARRQAIKALADTLETTGIRIRKDSKRYPATHQNSMVVDGATAVVMAFDLAPETFATARGFGMVTGDPMEIAEIQRVFEADWLYREAQPWQATLVWSPINARERLLSLINGAAASLDICAGELRDPECLKALADAAVRGVAVRVLCAGPDSAGGAPAIPGVRVKTGAILSRRATMILADHGTAKAAAYLGTAHLSTEALDKNRELGLLFSEAGILGRLHQTFETDWGK